MFGAIDGGGGGGADVNGGGGGGGALLPTAGSMAAESLESLCPVFFSMIYFARSEKSMSFVILKMGGFLASRCHSLSTTDTGLTVVFTPICSSSIVTLNQLLQLFTN